MKSYRLLIFSIAFVSCTWLTHAQVTLNPATTRALGAARLEQLATLTNLQPNLVEGRELNSPSGIALDTTSTPNHLYVADTLNNRVLGWKDANCVAAGVPTGNGGCFGAFADIVIGQNDFFTTLQQGPGRSGSTLQASGMTTPTGLTVDSKGNLYVVDTGNNRILRFPTPFAQTNGQFPDLVIGQQNFSSLAANAGGISAGTLNFSSGGSVLTAYLKFDSSNNLWVTDPGNQRVLRFPAASLTANGPSADLVLGQPDFSTNTLPAKYDNTSLTTLNYPTGIMFDPIGRLYISESIPTSQTSATRSRILVFQPPYSSNMAAQRIIGTVVTPTGGSPPPTVGPSQLGAAAGNMFNINNNIAIADSSNSRIMIYNPFQQFTSDTLTQNAQLVLCQTDANSGKSNRGNSDANNNSCQAPTDAIFSGPPGNNLFIADTGNNRVIVMPMVQPSSTLAFNNAVGLEGQQFFSQTAPNYIEGREFHFADVSGRADAGIAIDNSSNPPHLYIADTYNNRILCFVDYRTVQTGGFATFVIGQPDLFHADVNFNPNSPTSSSSTPTQVGLNAPTGVVVDPATGDLYVADSANSRVLRFPSPFTQSSKLLQPANLVLGQSSFTASITDVTASRMFEPYGLAWAPGVGLLVSDVVDNRVLLFPAPFQTGMSATVVWGQSSFGTAATGSADNQFNGPHGVAVDSAYRLYVADQSNNRVLVFDDVRRATSGSHSLVSIASMTGTSSLTTPRSVFVDQYTPPGGTTVDELWIGDSGRAIRFSGGYSDYFTSNFTPDLIIPVAGGAIALAVDQYYTLYTADIANRIALHYINLSALNGASFNTVRQTVAPNTIMSIFSQGGQFTGTQAATTVPLPTNMQSLQVLLNGTPVPLYYVSPGQINCLIPNNAPTSGTADLQVLRTDDGQTLGDTTINMTTVAPGIFTLNGGKGQAAAINDDGTANSSSNPVGRGHVLQVFGTGVGNISGAPNDGSAVTGPLQTAAQTQAYINGIPCTVQYSGLAPGQVGVWQVNVLIADAVPPTSTLSNRISELSIQLNNVPAEGLALYGIQVLVWVKQ
jgi:uncharacterized protein (TIGR03437 family)